jgi:DNA-3-methyladenine glycosylase
MTKSGSYAFSVTDGKPLSGNERRRDNGNRSWFIPSDVANSLSLQGLDENFFLRTAEEVARASVGKILVCGATAGRIVETEAYLGPSDRAAHAWHGITPRTRVLFGPPARAYVYRSYGVHWCLNFVCGPEGTAGCVLIRALEPLAGIASMRRRRGADIPVKTLASGPGNLTRAMGIDLKHNGTSLLHGPLRVFAEPGAPSPDIAVTPRIGIRHNRDWPLRFVAAGSPFASRKS